MKVTIAGQSMSVRTDADPRYIKTLAAFVEDKMNAARGPAKSATTLHQALLAALHIADDLKQLERRQAELLREVRERSRRILRHLDSEASREPGA